MNKLIVATLVIYSLIGLSGCSDDAPKESPVKIQTIIHDESFGSMPLKIPQITITAVADVTVEKVIVNEGNGCGVNSSRPKLPASMKYGERLIRTYRAQCNIMKVEVITNKGSWSVEYE